MKKKLKCMSMVMITLFIAFSFAGCEKDLNLNDPGNLVPKTVMEDPSLPSISVNGTKLHSEAFGDPNNPMVVILHGGPGVDYRSMLNCKNLANDGYYVVFYDQRGAGLSQRHDKNSFTIQQALDDLTGVISHYRKSTGQKVFLLGHSWGAMLATAYINTPFNGYPITISGLILAEPGGFTWEQTSDYISRTRKLSPFDESANDAFYPDQILTGKENDHEVLDYKMAMASAVLDTKEGNVMGNAGVYPFWRYGAASNSAFGDIGEKDGFNWTTNLHQYTTKVLFCYSELNKAYGLQHAQLLSSAYPNVQLEKIMGSGHEIAYFGWNNFYPLVKTYLNSLR